MKNDPNTKQKPTISKKPTARELLFQLIEHHKKTSREYHHLMADISALSLPRKLKRLLCIYRGFFQKANQIYMNDTERHVEGPENTLANFIDALAAARHDIIALVAEYPEGAYADEWIPKETLEMVYLDDGESPKEDKDKCP